MKNVLSIVGYTFAAVILLLLLLAGFTQTSLFKNRLRASLISILAPHIHGSLQISAIRGNLLTELSVDSIVIYDGARQCISIGALEVHYDPFTLVNRHVSIQQMILNRAQVYLARSSDGVWNFKRIFPSSNEPPGPPSRWEFDATSLELRNSGITVIDSLALADSPDGGGRRQVQLHNFSVRDINLHASCFYHPENLSADISSAYASAHMPGIIPITLHGSLRANADGVRIGHLLLKTGKSDIQVDGRIARANIFRALTADMLQHDTVSVALEAKKIDLAELSSFLPDTDMLQGTAAVDLDAHGDFGSLLVRRLNIRTGGSVLRLAGTLRNLHEPQHMTINAIVGDSRIDPKDAGRLITDIRGMKFLDAGMQSLELQFNGSPKKFNAVVHLEGRSGTIVVSGNFDFQHHEPGYDLTLGLKKFQPALVINGLPPMSLTASGALKGRGVSADSILAHLDLSIDSAGYRQIALSHSRIIIDAAPRHFVGTAELNAGAMQAGVNADIDVAIPQRPVIHAAVTTTALDLAPILGDTGRRSSLTLNARVSSTGRTINDLNGSVDVEFAPSSYRGFPIDSGHIAFTLDQKDPAQKMLALRSSYADADLNGKFDIGGIKGILTEQIPNLVRTILTHPTARETSAVTHAAAGSTIDKRAGEGENLNFSYRFDIRNISLVSAIAGTTPFNATGSFAGMVRGDDQKFSVTSKGNLSHFAAGSSGDEIGMDSCSFSFAAGNIALTRTLETISGNFEIGIRNGSVKTTQMNNIHASSAFGDSKSTFTFSGEYDTLYTLMLAGSAAVEPHAYAIDLDSLRVASRNVSLHNVNDAQFRLDTGGVHVLHATLQHQEDYVNLEGTFASSGRFDARASVRGFPLDEINTFLFPSRLMEGGPGYSGTTDADVELSGTAVSPEFSFNATIDSAAFRDKPLGRVAIGVHYADQLAHVDLAARRNPADTLPQLSVVGELPIDLAFNGVEKRFPDAEQRLTIHSAGYDIGILEWLLPELKDLNGALTGDLIVGGTPAVPIFSGLLSLRNAEFTFGSNNLPYILNGELVPGGDTVALRNFIIANAPEEKTRGTSRVEGSIRFKDYNLDRFDLTVFGDLLVMSDASRESFPTLYGTLFVEMGPDGVKFRGTSDHPNLTGTLLIRDANLTMPPARITAVTSSSGLTLPYVVVDDTAKSKTENLSARPAGSDGIIRDVAAPDSGGRKSGHRRHSNESFTAKLRYNLSVETRGQARILMIVTPETNEELYAELDGKITAINESGTPSIFGEINVGSQSYYNFIKRFSASGNLNFEGQWDNPAMNVTATYQAYKTLLDTSAARTGAPEKVIVDLDITGTRYEPKLAIHMKLQSDAGQTPIDYASKYPATDEQSDAISFLLTGKFRDEMTAADNASVSSVGSSASSTFVTGVLSSSLSDVLTRALQQQFPFIQSATISYNGSESDLRISTEVYKGYLRYGGQVLSDINNSNVSYQVSIGDMLNNRTIRNLFIELMHTVENPSTSESRRSTNGARVYYKISF